MKEKGVLTEALAKALDDALTLAEAEEIYRPYKEKRKTKASAAIEAGFGPLAEEILKQKQPASSLADEESLEQAGYILAQQIADDIDLRKKLRAQLQKTGSLESKLKKDAVDEGGIYETYYDFSNPLKNVPSHRVMALDRGEKQGILTVSVTCDAEPLEAIAARKYIKNNTSKDYLMDVIHDALIRLILPSLRREIRSDLKEKAQKDAIAGFSRNLEHLLMTRPVKGQRVLAWDPGYAHGCKLAVLDKNGDLLDTTVVFPFPYPKNNQAFVLDSKTEAVMNQLMKRWQPTLIVIGNGTASRESMEAIAKFLENYPDVSYVIGSESGASVYSASPIAKEEFPDLPVEKRSAISIGRRVQDPLSELIKIDPKSLGIGEYQHDVPPKQLKESLDFAADKAVNRVGVNVNTASAPLLAHVSGLTKVQINKILKARQEHPFTNRKELEALLPAKTYQQSIGFLRILHGTNPLDRTGIHPESYEVTEKLLAKIGKTSKDIGTRDFEKSLLQIAVKPTAKELGVDEPTLRDIMMELFHPGLDPRDKLDGPILKKGVLTIEDLKPGMQLQGTVQNVTSFGAFVDIGLHENGLVHISQLSDQFVSDPASIVHTGQIVNVRILDVDLRRKRISLTMKDAK